MTVRELRKKLGWTQQRLALEMQASLRTVTRWEAESNNPRGIFAAKLSELAKANGIDDFAPNCPCCGRPL